MYLHYTVRYSYSTRRKLAHNFVALFSVLESNAIKLYHYPRQSLLTLKVLGHWPMSFAF